MTKVTLVAPSGSCAFVAPSPWASGELDSGPDLTWMAEATGTFTVCSSWCDYSTAAIDSVDDTTLRVSRGREHGWPVPTDDFRQLLASNGGIWTPEPDIPE